MKRGSWIFGLLFSWFWALSAQNELNRNFNNLTESYLKINKCSNSLVKEKLLKIPRFLIRAGNQNNSEIAILRLEEYNLKCKNYSSVSIPLSQEHDMHYILLSNGYMKYKDVYLSPDEFCLVETNWESENWGSNSRITFNVCERDLEKECTKKFPCVQKCCEFGHVLDLSHFNTNGKITCRPSIKTYWTPEFYEDAYTKLPKVKNIRYISHDPILFCNDSISLMSLRSFHSQPILPFRLLPNGKILEKIHRRKWSSVGELVCVDGAQNFPLDDTLSGAYSGAVEDTVVIDCRQYIFETEDTENIQHQDYSTKLYVIALSIGVLFLVFTLLAHIVLWEKNSIRGWILMCYVTLLALEFCCLIWARLISYIGPCCTFAAILTHLTALMTFCWLTTMNFDVWFSFKSMSPVVTRKAQLKLFQYYAIFATCIPISIVTLGLVLEHFYGDDQFSEVIVPEYGKSRCGLGTSAEFPYLFGPISLLLTTNFIFLIFTLWYIYRNSKTLKSAGIKATILNDKLRFFGMLFLVAGVTWIFDVISWATTEANVATPWYWMFFDFVNILQPIAIFLIFVCNRKTMQQLQKKIPCLSNLNFWRQQSQSKLSNQEGGISNFLENGRKKLSITQIYSLPENGTKKDNMELNEKDLAK